MATRLTRPEQVQRNRGLVLDAARRVFLRRGYAGATLDAIAEEAGFSKGVVYSQFAGKPDLLLALLEQRIEERAEENARAVEGLAGMDGLRALLGINARRSQGAPAWSRLLIEFRIAAARDPGLNARYAAAHEVAVARFAEAIDAVAARGGLRFVHGPLVAARLIFAIDAGATLERIAEPGALPDHVLDDLVSRLTEPS
jgi:AcrR family transcriptional regulator